MLRLSCIHLLALGTSMFAAIAMAGCDESEQGGGFSGPDGTAEPPSGVWRYDDEGVSENTCGDGIDLTRDPDTEFLLTAGGDGTFTVDQGQAGEDFECTIADDNSFSCPFRLYGEEVLTEYDITLTWNVSVQGDFQADDRMQGVQIVDITCEGAGCALAGMYDITLPCSYTVDFSAKAR